MWCTKITNCRYFHYCFTSAAVNDDEKRNTVYGSQSGNEDAEEQSEVEDYENYKDVFFISNRVRQSSRISELFAQTFILLYIYFFFGGGGGVFVV